MSSSVYDYNAQDYRGENVSLKTYEGKVLLIVNTASACGFTPQYEGLQDLYEKYKDEGLEILAFPCNQFKEQEKGSNEEIKSFCDLHFNIQFPLFAKIDVNGDNAHPLYKHLKQEAPGILGSQGIKWNFTKFLVGRDGKVIQRYSTMTKPKAIEPAIKALL
ncbi:glutathione peroxidase [Thalassotalea euphylliae]|uniref:Glutathione peroxidase n=1 Tax=Thalassotalea euphylliae TaxID=1655234 RepID=A0A3E0UFD1_9GAMM|nr:glutathione peroxidase [Thalassotalea euphylliae]REL35721.1 glutathione peroxidase [Thalassotalea euphylliae]